MNKGKRIWESLRNEDSKDIGVSEWLLLYVLKEKPIDIGGIHEKLENLWQEIRKRKPDFYFVWPKSDNGHKAGSMTIKKELHRFEGVGLTIIHSWQDDEPLWHLTERGEKTLKDYFDQVRGTLIGIIPF